MNAKPLAHTTERSTYYPFNVLPPLPIPIPLPVTPSPPTQEQKAKQKRTRLRALTQILACNLMQNQNGRDTYFKLKPMIKQAENGVGSQSKGLSETPDELSPPSPLSLSQFAFFAPYPNCNSISTSNTHSNAPLRSHLIHGATICRVLLARLSRYHSNDTCYTDETWTYWCWCF